MCELTLFEELVPGPAVASGTTRGRLVLPFAERQKARQRAVLDDGTAIGIVLPRGTVLRGGDWLRSAGGLLVEVVAACEPVSTAASADPLLLARAAYHLGNRHVPLEVGAGCVRYLRDHVLDAMVANLGLAVAHEERAFEPESGAYLGGHGHGHAH